jgi:hypothetical protein
MSKTAQNQDSSPELYNELERKSPNLFLLYALLAVALLAAIGFAVMIVWPFYGRR